MNNDITVTVISLAYNHEQYIRQALESMVSQKTNFKFEVLVHDDASTDCSADIIREYAQKYPDIIKPILQTENQLSQGKSITKDILVPRAKGKYIAFCECDDFWCDENKLQKQFDIMESNPNVSMCVHKVNVLCEEDINFESVYPPERYGINQSMLINGEKYIDLLLKGYTFQTGSYFIRKSVFESDLYLNLKTKVNGDRRMSYAALYCGDIYYIDEIMSCYRFMTYGSFTYKSRNMDKDKKFFRQTNLIDSLVELDAFTNKKYHKKIVVHAYSRLHFMLKNSDHRQTLEYFKTFNKNVPFVWGNHPRLNLNYLMMKYAPKILSSYIKKKSKAKE